MGSKKRSQISDEIEDLVHKMRNMEPGSLQYTNAAAAVKTLCEARSFKNENTIGAETLLLAGVNILGILIVCYYEQGHSVISKAVGFIFKTRV